MTRLHLAVALDGTGWHPAAGRHPLARPASRRTGFWRDLLAVAERGSVDVVTFEGRATLLAADPSAPDPRVDAALLAAWSPKAATRLALVPTATTARIEPFPVDADPSPSALAPSITLGPPGDQPLVAVLARSPAAHDLAARVADVVLVCPEDLDDVFELIEAIREAEASVGRSGPPLLVYADLLVLLAPTPARAEDALDELDALDGAPLRSDARIEVTTADDLADLLEDWHRAGIDGVRLRPARLPLDLVAVAYELVPELRRRRLLPRADEDGTLRERLGLAPPPMSSATGHRPTGDR